MRPLVAVLVLVLTGCASAQLSDGAKRVRLQSVTPTPGCKYLGEVTGSDTGPSVSGMLWTHSEDLARIDLKNAAAAMGADTVEIITESYKSFTGEAYRCEKP